MAQDTLTRWAISGGGGCGVQIALKLLEESSPGIRQRVSAVGSNEDIHEITEQHTDTIAVKEADSLDLREHVMTVQPNDSLLTEPSADTVTDLSTLITNTYPSTDAVLHISGAASPLANYIPYTTKQILDRSMDIETPPWVDAVTWGSILSLPFGHERAKQQFIAMKALAQIYDWMEWTILVSNQKLRRMVDQSGKAPYRAINGEICQMIHLLVAASRLPDRLLHPVELAEISQCLDTCVLVPGVSRESPTATTELRSSFVRAAKNSFAPVEVSTAESAFGIVAAPESVIRSNDITPLAVKRAFAEWQRDAGISVPGSAVLVPVPSENNDTQVEPSTMVVLASPDISPAVSLGVGKYRSYRNKLIDAGKISEAQLKPIEKVLAGELGLDV